MKVLLVGIGAAGNKAIMYAVANGTAKEEDTIMVNATSKDFPKEYDGKKIIISPDNHGCGKERNIARDHAITAIKSGKISQELVEGYSTVFVVSSVEGGTGSGSAPIIAQFFAKSCRKNVNVVAFTGFEEDVRGLSNTVEFFQELDPTLIVSVISNKEFLRDVQNSKFRAEEMANREFCRRVEIFTGANLIDSDQNIDDTDILKVSNTTGYSLVEYAEIKKPFVDQEDFNQFIKKMIYNSRSPKSSGNARIGVFLNIREDSQDAIDFNFPVLKEAFGNPYECFMHKQWDGKVEYIAYIIAGLDLPIEEMKAVYERYKAQTAKVNKASDGFFSEMKNMQLAEEDRRFDMIKPVDNEGMSVGDFLSQFETKK